jgi:hypothetical protein
MKEHFREYQAALSAYTVEVERISADSLAAANLRAGDQRYWASVLMIRLVAVASAILFICPDSVLNPDGLLWDFGGVAALIRSVFEAVLMLFYLGIEDVPEDEWKLRIAVVHLHDCTERIRLFYGYGMYDQLASFIPMATEFRRRIRENQAFASIFATTQKDILRGDRPTIFGKGEILKRIGEEPGPILNYYRFVSNYIHNFPFGFHRTGEQGRDLTINEVDVVYTGQALRWAAEWLSKAAQAYEAKFKGLTQFGKRKFDVRALRRSNLLSARDRSLIEKVFGG